MVGSHDTAAAARLTVGVIGLGLIGGSLARRLAIRGVSVVAWNHRPHPYAQAEADGIRCMRTLAELVEAQPDVIVLCNPLKAMPAILGELRPLLEPYQDITLTDVGSVKMMVRDQVRDAGLAGRYVGAHPMAGNELSGWAAAAPALYDNALWAMTVDGDTDYRRFLAVARMITDDAGNRVIVLDDDTHDRAAALISHMPHVVATALINQLTDDPDRNIAAALAAGSWRDMTRVALTDPDRTRAMVEEDADNVERLLRMMRRGLPRSRTNCMAQMQVPSPRFSRMDSRSATTSPRSEAVRTGTAGLRPDDTRGGMAAALLDSARRGEHILRFGDDYTACVQRRSAM